MELPPTSRASSGGHLNDETLSASLDDALEGVGVIEPHLSSCAACRSRLADLAAASSRVAAAVISLPAPAAAALVARAMDAAAIAPSAPPVGQHRRRRRRPAIHPGWLAGFAAAVLLVLAMPALLSGLGRVGGGTDSESSAESAASGDSAGETSIDSADAGGASTDNLAQSLSELRGPPTADTLAADLGDHTSREVLAARVRSILSERATAPATTGAAPGPERLTAVPCATAVRDAGGGVLTGGRYMGSARWLGEPSVVLSFDLAPPAPGATARLYVLRPAGCAVLATAQW